MEKIIEPSSAPPALTFYRGGLNVGIFQPGPPVYSQGSEVLGNPDVGDAFTYRVQAFDPGEKSHGWVLIVSGEDSRITIKKYGEIKSSGNFSSYDGLYNKTLLTTIGKFSVLQYNKSSYTDWYIPSKDELAFICKNLPVNFSADFRFKPMQRRYLSSTYVKNSTRKRNFLHSQLFFPDTYGVTSLVEDLDTSFVRYVRRVPVKII
jgi:hypothetical protein